MPFRSAARSPVGQAATADGVPLNENRLAIELTPQHEKVSMCRNVTPEMLNRTYVQEQLAVVPTTTIGSYPQTEAIRKRVPTKLS